MLRENPRRASAPALHPRLFRPAAPVSVAQPSAPAARLDRHSLGDGGSPFPRLRQGFGGQAIPRLARYGKGKVFSAAEGIGTRSWQMKRSKLSKRASTRWDELMTVK